MTAGDVDEPNPYSERYDVSLTLLGANLDADGLSKGLRRKRAVDAWRAGDVRGGCRIARTSGMRIEVADTAIPEQAVQAVEQFLTDEDVFFHAARSMDPDARFIMSCALWVYASTPTTVSLPHTLLRRLAQFGIDWEVTGYPCAGDEE